eukprot:3478526-Pleurochrysis_carterae.AAC.1
MRHISRPPPRFAPQLALARAAVNCPCWRMTMQASSSPPECALNAALCRVSCSFRKLTDPALTTVASMLRLDTLVRRREHPRTARTEGERRLAAREWARGGNASIGRVQSLTQLGVGCEPQLRGVHVEAHGI